MRHCQDSWQWVARPSQAEVWAATQMHRFRMGGGGARDDSVPFVIFGTRPHKETRYSNIVVVSSKRSSLGKIYEENKRK